MRLIRWVRRKCTPPGCRTLTLIIPLSRVVCTTNIVAGPNDRTCVAGESTSYGEEQEAPQMYCDCTDPSLNWSGDE